MSLLKHKGPLPSSMWSFESLWVWDIWSYAEKVLLVLWLLVPRLAHRVMHTNAAESTAVKLNSSFSARDGLETRCSEQVRGQHLEKSLGDTLCETRLRGSSVASSVASEQRSRSSSFNSTDSGSGLLLPGLQAPPELDQGGQPSSQRFSVISSEDFDQELIVKPIKVKKRRRKRKTGIVHGQVHTDSYST